ncbi:hypothetical protein [Paraburkholderia dipogonis]
MVGALGASGAPSDADESE